MNEKTLSTEERLVALETKIDQIVQALEIKSTTTKLPRAPIELKAIPESITEKKQISVPTPKPEAPPVHNNFLPILATICFGMAGIFIVKLAIESGWLTPIRQWGLLTLLGLLIGSAGIFLSKIEKDYRSYLGAASLIILYLAVYSGLTYFNLYNEYVAIALASLVSFLGFYFLTFFESESFTIIASIGTYIAPLILGKQADLISLCGFFIVWAIVFSKMSSILKSRPLLLVSAYLGLGIFLYLNKDLRNPDDVLVIIFLQCAQFIIYAFGVVYYSLKNKMALKSGEAMAYLPLLIFFYGNIYFLLNIYNEALAPYISLGFAAFLYLLYFKAKQGLKNIESQNMIQLFLGLVVFHSGYLQLIPASGKPWLLPIIILAKYIAEKKETIIAPVFKFVFFLISLIEFASLCFHLITETHLANALPAFFTVILGGVYYLKLGKNVKNKEGLFLSLIHILSVLTLYRIAYEYGTLAVSALWGIYSIAILTYGYVQKNSVVAKSSLVVLVITSLKALVYDVSMTSSSLRIFSLIFTGVVLYGAGYLFQIINKWEKETDQARGM